MQKIHVKTSISTVLLSFLFLSFASVQGMADDLIVIRHGQAMNNILHQFNSHLDSEKMSLTDLGKKQVQESAKSLQTQDHYSNKNIAAVYSSPMPRTQQTAEILIKEMGIDPKKFVLDQGLIEMDFGKLDGKRDGDAEVVKFCPDAENWEYPRAHEYGGETDEDMNLRLSKFISRLKAKKIKGNVILVTHGGPMIELLRILHQDPKKGWHPKNAEFKRVPFP